MPSQTALRRRRRPADPASPTRLNVDLDRETHKRLKMVAVNADMFVSDLVRDLLDQYLLHQEEAAPDAKLLEETAQAAPAQSVAQRPGLPTAPPARLGAAQ